MTSGRLKTQKDTDMDSTIGVLVRYSYLVVFGRIGADLETPRHRACAAPRGRIPSLARPRLPDDGLIAATETGPGTNLDPAPA
jgi:hypothetical protein